jgi:hypothetical protein
VAGSKDRPRWDQLPAATRAGIEALVGGDVLDAENCPGGFSPGLASRLTLADGRQVFVKAMDGVAWPHGAQTHRVEARVAAALPRTAPAPAFLGSFDAGGWVALAFEYVAGAEPGPPWPPATLARVVDAISTGVAPAAVELPADHPRLGGWGDVDRDELRRHSSWAADQLEALVAWEAYGLVAAQGESLVHMDLYPHNMLVTMDRVVFVDWPHARRGSSIVDLVMFLSAVAADGVDPEPWLRSCPLGTVGSDDAVNGILAAHSGFLVATGMATMPPGLEAIAAAKLRLGLATVDWLRRRLGDTASWWAHGPRDGGSGGARGRRRSRQ